VIPDKNDYDAKIEKLVKCDECELFKSETTKSIKTR
jgi:hypothetical protein